MFSNHGSASSIGLTVFPLDLFIHNKPEIPKCVDCGNDLYWYGDESDGIVISRCLHRKWDAMNSADAFRCNKCYNEKQKRLT